MTVKENKIDYLRRRVREAVWPKPKKYNKITPELIKNVKDTKWIPKTVKTPYQSYKYPKANLRRFELQDGKKAWACWLCGKIARKVALINVAQDPKIKKFCSKSHKEEWIFKVQKRRRLFK